MMMLKNGLKGQIGYFNYLLLSMIITYILLGMWAQYDVGVNCPSYETLKAQYQHVENINITNGTLITGTTPDPFYLSSIYGFVTLLFSGCTGISWEIYLVIFVVPIIVIIIYLFGVVTGGGP